ncbi:MAG: Gfo/Idh/MocA family oxidoreductase [Chloroflexi bacterium]|nr:Gfo/Idh/MocA family oxidoreductase [Chloroflexota bacterium]
MHKTKIGVIGCGYWGPKLARNFHELPSADLRWVADFRTDRLAHMQELYPGVAATRDYQEVLASDVEAVAIATPVSTHHQLAMQALAAGKHILVEKPLAATVAQALDITDAADNYGLVAMVGHTFQYNPAVNRVRDLIASGELGQIYYINATRVNLGLFQPDINVMWDLAPHDISILLHILGTDPCEVSAQGEAYVQKRTGIHEVAYLTLRFPGDILASLRVSWLDPVKTRRITVVGSKKMLVYDDIADTKVVLYDKGVEVPPYSDTPQEFYLSYRHGPETVVPVRWEEPLHLECRAFVGCIQDPQARCVRCSRRDQVSCSTARVGVKVVRILEQAQKSLMNGGGRELIGLR